MKKKIMICYGLSIFSGIAVLMWILEMIRGEFLQDETGGFCLAIFSCVLFFFLGWRASGKDSASPPEK